MHITSIRGRGRANRREAERVRVNGRAERDQEPMPRTARIVPVILSGGSGTRLWPVSRDSLPKQLWPLISNRTMLQETALRCNGELDDNVSFAPPMVVCNQNHRFVIATQLQAAGIHNARIVLEPSGRNTAPAITAAALLLAEEDPDTILWMMPADSVIADIEALQGLLPAAVAAARLGRIVTFGVKPTAPESGYGYIQMGSPLGDVAGVYDVGRFVEKPSRDVAADLVASGRNLWNSGMFVFAAGTLLEELKAYEPEIARRVAAAVAHRRQDLDFIRLGSEAFMSCPDISLDRAIAERTTRAAVIPADIAWSDVASWDSLWRVSPKDPRGNAVLGDALLEGAEDCYVRSDGTLTAVVGLKDAIVVVTGDAVLAMHRDYAQDVREVVRRLRHYGRKEVVAHSRSHRPWGFYESLILQERFQVKRIVVNPGRKLSLQKHFHRAEHWVVVHGSALVTRDAEQLLVRENESVHLPLGCVHRLENPGRIPLTLIEVQVGPYLGEDDIVRIEDHYARSY